MRILSSLLIFLTSFVIVSKVGFGESHSAEIGTELRRFVNSPARVVWVQDHGDNADSAALGDQLKLMGLDTEDRQGVRPLLDHIGNFAKPLFLQDGSGIIFTDRREGEVFYLPWGGDTPQPLTPGFGLATWYDWDADVHYVFVGRKAQERTYHQIVRIPINEPENEKVVWSRAPISEDNFQLSADGRFASGNFPWPHCGVADLQESSWQRLGDGCWTILAPDNSVRFAMLDGAHRNLIVFDRGGSNRRVVPLNVAPGTEGFSVYQPRWTNHPQFLTMNGPYKMGTGGGAIRSGGPDVEIFIGKWNENFDGFDDWFQLTQNDQANFLSDVWIASGFRPHEVFEEGQETETAPKVTEINWPAVRENMALIWSNRAGSHATRDLSGEWQEARFDVRHRARYGPHLEMDIRNGYFESLTGEAPLRHRVNQTGNFYMELLVTAGREKPDVRGTIAAASRGDQETESFSLVESGGRALFITRWERRPGSVETRQFSLGAVNPGEPTHLAVQVVPGMIRGWRNGELAFERALSGRLPEWIPHHLTFGSLATMQNRWEGGIEFIAIGALVMDETSVQQNARTVLDAVADRESAVPVIVDARLVEASPMPTPEAIEPYRRALAAHHYRVERVIEGDFDETDILVSHWVILDREVLSEEKRSEGQRFRLRIVPFEKRPDLEGERLVMDLEDPLLPIFFDISESVREL